MKNVIQFRNGFVNLPNAGQDNSVEAMTVAAELMQFGYVLNKHAIENLSAASVADITAFYEEVVSFLKTMTGSMRNYKAFWPGFPQQVMEKSECELLLHQILHYISEGTYSPNEWTQAKPTAFERSTYTIVAAGTEEQFLSIFTDLVSVNNSLTGMDMDTVKWFVSSGTKLVFPEKIPFKENLCVLAGMGLDVPVQTVTDVLRIAVHMSGGDTSLPKLPNKTYRPSRWSSAVAANPERETFKFAKFTRSQRKHILSLLEKTNCDVREMKLKAGRWVRLGEILHPGEYKDKYKKAFAAFNTLRNDKVVSWYGEVDKAFKKSFEAGVKKLAERAGEFVRRIDSLVRNADSDQLKLVYPIITDVLTKSSNKVLFEFLIHIENRKEGVTVRNVKPKGARKTTELPSLPALDEKVARDLSSAVYTALRNKFATLEPMGEVWLDPELEKIPLPQNMRSLNPALKPVIRGQRVPFGNESTKCVRAYIHWFDERGNEDIDLTATFLGMGQRAIVGWNGEHNASYATYSGDVRCRQGACAEYIDVDIAEALSEGFRYVVLDARNYQGRGFDTMKECVFGYMERSHPKANKIFVPKTIENAVLVQTTSVNCVIAVLDLETKEYIFLDIDQDGLPVARLNTDSLIKSVKQYAELPKFSVYDLLALHVESRGELVELPGEGVTTMRAEDFMTSYVETLKWMGV